MRMFADRYVGAVGLGCMGMSWAYTESERDDRESVALIREAVDLGVTFLDTSDVYGAGHNEQLVGRALGGVRDKVVLGSKVGLVVDPATGDMVRDGSPGHVREAVEASLRRLGTDVIDLYYLHRIDPEVPLVETWGAMSELVAEGKVGRLGLSEVTVAQAEEAHGVHPVSAIQSELSLWTRDPLAAGGVVGWCAASGAAFVPFSPLGRGFLTGAVTKTSFEDNDFRAGLPRFQKGVLEQNFRIVDVVRTVADRHGATPAQVAIAWTLAQGDHVIPIPGTKKRRYLHENTMAAGVDLTDEDLAELDAVPPPVGARY
ncbi:aldo/keto reductase [Actinoallomurus bryophytorum]|uniref:Aryl-alcohol dehydrogenase-like predicted oxidoreductase n=1 Tax=Actinoallomurus bryophytorum TaxID=1490222 RepID=A0A543CKR0_9ACTN|nr:aldo/keto reductase [Actinoallomurus bryophytorum]TQL97477.1 aryl-alcohol dehydrogenase-like predicted oxidoreductase [Actinoallomurus bryophytorum]